MGRLYRTQILLDPEQHKTLAEIARREGRSISEVVREMIGRQLEERESDSQAQINRRLAALERIRENRDKILQRRGGVPIDIDTVELIHRIREERDAEILGTGTDSGN